MEILIRYYSQFPSIGDFSYNDTNNNFVWDANNSLVVLGSASFNVDDFYNRGKIDIANEQEIIFSIRIMQQLKLIILVLQHKIDFTIYIVQQ